MPQRRLSSGGSPSPLKRRRRRSPRRVVVEQHLIDSPAWVKCSALGKRMGPEQPPYVMCTVASIDGETCSISLPDGSAVAGVSTSDVSWAHEGENPADHCGLMHLSEATVLHNTVQRAADGKFYTWVGPGQLISVNPCKRIAELFGEKKMGEFRGRMVGTTADTLEPHAYAVAEAAMSELHRRPRVAVLVSGGRAREDRGQPPRRRLHRVARRRNRRAGESPSTRRRERALGGRGRAALVGDARGARQRVHGRQLELVALRQVCAPALRPPRRRRRRAAPRRARVSTFLLEVRLCSHGKGEYNFHVLYQLLAGAPSCEGVGGWGSSAATIIYATTTCAGRRRRKDAAPSAAAKARAKKRAGGAHEMYQRSPTPRAR